MIRLALDDVDCGHNTESVAATASHCRCHGNGSMLSVHKTILIHQSLSGPHLWSLTFWLDAHMITLAVYSMHTRACRCGIKQAGALPLRHEALPGNHWLQIITKT